jgi:hypothetical protein
MRKREKRNFKFPKKQIIPPVKSSGPITFSARKVISFSLAKSFLVSERLLLCHHFEYEACLECG